MSLAASIFLMAVGAILRFAVADRFVLAPRFDGVDLGVIGLVLMLAGGVGLLINLVLHTGTRRPTRVEIKVVRDEVLPPF